jgi:hypothetical protein
MNTHKLITLPSGRIAQIHYSTLLHPNDLRDVEAYKNLKHLKQHKAHSSEEGARFDELSAKTIIPKECAVKAITFYKDEIIEFSMVRTTETLMFNDLKFLYAEVCALIIFVESTPVLMANCVVEDELPF